VPPTNDHEYEEMNEKLEEAALDSQVQVFPIHLFDREKPLNFFFYNPYVCAPLGKLLLENEKIPRVADYLTGFRKDWGEKVLKSIGKEGQTDFLNSYMNVFKIMDNFVAAYTEGKELKAMTDAGIDLAAFNETAFDFHFNDILYKYNGDPEKLFAKISMSSFIRDILKWMDGRINADKDGKGYNGYKAPKYVMYSGHDVTLGSAQQVFWPALGIDPFFYTPFASSLFFELHRSEEGADEKGYTVKVIYNDHELKEVPYTDFKDKVGALMMSDAEISEKCGFTPARTSFIKKNNKLRKAYK